MPGKHTIAVNNETDHIKNRLRVTKQRDGTAPSLHYIFTNAGTRTTKHSKTTTQANTGSQQRIRTVKPLSTIQTVLSAPS
jgi:hypothetical protein